MRACLLPTVTNGDCDMTSQKLTDTTIKRKKPTKGTLELWDTVVPGLALRIGYGGRRSYCVTTRINGRQVRRTIGTTVTHTLAQARNAARNVLLDAAKGIDSHSKKAMRKLTLLQSSCADGSRVVRGTIGGQIPRRGPAHERRSYSVSSAGRRGGERTASTTVRVSHDDVVNAAGG